MIGPFEPFAGSQALDSGNHFGVIGQGERLAIVNWWAARWRSRFLTREEALNLAVWMALLADPGLERFRKIVASVTASAPGLVLAAGGADEITIAEFPVSGINCSTPLVTKEDALTLAAALAVVADPGLAKFNQWAKEIEGS